MCRITILKERYPQQVPLISACNVRWVYCMGGLYRRHNWIKLHIPDACCSIPYACCSVPCCSVPCCSVPCCSVPCCSLLLHRCSITSCTTSLLAYICSSQLMWEFIDGWEEEHLNVLLHVHVFGHVHLGPTVVWVWCVLNLYFLSLLSSSPIFPSPSKVRELAASTLSGLIHCGFVKNLSHLKVEGG